MTSISLIELLSSRKWDQALFTTYALSLTFFETCVLRALRQQGCRQIFLVADVDGYQSSLSERRSTGVGHEYRVIPVALPNGVFHPKCTYLSGPDGDVMVIGSGNITFGGFGRNLEVFEILEPESSPIAFKDFADFLDSLGNRTDLIIPDKTWIPQFSLQARLHAHIQSEELTPSRLLHSVNTPIVDQIIKSASDQADGTLTVLSPFHDTDGNAVKRLAKGIKASKIRVALPPLRSSETTFPFPVVKSWGIDVSAVTPEVQSPNRCLHAKWFQLDCPGSDTITVTGSINATSKALCSIDNIEVGVLRSHSPEEGWVTWIKSDIPKDITTLSFKASGLGNKCIVHAVLRNDGALSGWLIAANDFTGTWEGYLESGSGEQFAVSVAVDNAGRFTSLLSAPDNLLFATGLQIALIKGDRRARGWVTQEDILKLGREQRTIIRFLNDENTIDDEIALLAYLASSVNRFAPLFGSRIKVIKLSDDSEDHRKMRGPVTFHLSDIAPVMDGSSGEMTNIATNGHAGEFDLFARLRRYLLGERFAPQKELKIIGAEVPDDGDGSEAQTEQPRKKVVVKRLDEFETCIRQCLDETKDSARRRTALVYWFEVKIHIMKRHNWREEGIVFVRMWFWRACAEKLLVSPFEALEQHLFTAAAIFALMLPDDGSRQQSLVMIHEGLERYIGGPVNRDLAFDVLIDHPEVGFASFLVPSREADLVGALEDVLKAVTLRTQLESELQRHEAGQTVNGDLLIFKSAIGLSFLDAIKRRQGVKCYKPAQPIAPVCPFCYTALTVQAENDLKYYRIAQCSNCSKFAVNVKP